MFEGQKNDLKGCGVSKGHVTKGRQRNVFGAGIRAIVSKSLVNKIL